MAVIKSWQKGRRKDPLRQGKLRKMLMSNTRDPLPLACKASRTNPGPVFLTAFAALAACALSGAFQPSAFAQARFAPSGNMNGMGVEGQMMNFEASLRAMNPEGAVVAQAGTGGWGGRGGRGGQPFQREGSKHTLSTVIQGVPAAFTTAVTDTGDGTARIDVEMLANGDASLQGVYYCFEVPRAAVAGGTAELIEPASLVPAVRLDAAPPEGRTDFLRATAKGIRFGSKQEQIEVTAAAPFEIVVRQQAAGQPGRGGSPDMSATDAAAGNYQVYCALATGNVVSGQKNSCAFHLKVSGEIDRQPVALALDPAQPGPAFAGIGGNFRMQFPNQDPQVVKYNLDNLRAGWGRISMAWELWQPDENADPIQQAKAGRLNPNFYRQAEMARLLAQRRIPVIASVWSAPRWAQLPNMSKTKLDPAKMGQICESICKYLLYLKSECGLEAALFSFNESDTGVQVLQTPEEHVAQARQLGQYFAAKGLTTKMLLGDTARCTVESARMVEPAFADPALHSYAGAVAFHTYVGCADSDLAVWKEAARKLQLPLLVTEASLDGSAHLYPWLFTENWFQVYEADLMTRILWKTQASTMMVWQLTADYSVLAGGGIYGDNGPLRPTLRFWYLKQLGSTPPGAFALPITCDRPRISCAAYGDLANGAYAVHIVNTGAARETTLSGLPAGMKELRAYVSDFERGMQEGPRVPVVDGKARFTLDAAAFTSLFGTAAGTAPNPPAPR